MNRLTQTGVLRRLFLTLTLRGKIDRGLAPSEMPRSIARMLAADGIVYAIGGSSALFFVLRPSAELVLYLHCATMALIGLWLASTARNLFTDREEALVLSFRPVTNRAMVWAKALVMAQIALGLAAAFNLPGVLIGTFGSDGRGWFVLAHAIAVAANVVFCLGCALLFQQTRAQWRARARGRVATRVGLAFAAYLAALGWALHRPGHVAYLVPPEWFAGLDDALLGGGRPSWIVAGWGAGVTGLVWLAALRGLDRRDWVWSLETDGAARQGGKGRIKFRLLTKLLRSRVAVWGLRAPAARAAFELTSLSLARSRSLRLRLLGALSPILGVPLLLLLTNHGSGLFGPFSITFAGTFLGLGAVIAVHMIEQSDDWQAAEIFLCSPLAGPTELCRGARRAVSMFCVIPMVLFYAAVVWWTTPTASALELLLPGLFSVPLLTAMPNLRGVGVPFIRPPGGGQAPILSREVAWICCYSAIFAAIVTTFHGGLSFWILLLLESACVAWACRRIRPNFEALKWTL